MLEENAEVYLENKDALSPIDIASKEIKRRIHRKLNEIKVNERKQIDLLMKKINELHENLENKLNEKEEKSIVACKINHLQARLNNTLLFSLNKVHLISCSVDHSIKIWDIANEVCLRTLTGHKSTVCFESYWKFVKTTYYIEQ